MNFPASTRARAPRVRLGQALGGGAITISSERFVLARSPAIPRPYSDLGEDGIGTQADLADRSVPEEVG
jgi:hypothetical protein